MNSATTFLRRDVVERVGQFDERLGLGSPDPWASGEEVDYLIRAIDAGARIEYDPSLVVRHAVVPDDSRIGYRDGATVGYLLRKHGYPAPLRRAHARAADRRSAGVTCTARRLCGSVSGRDPARPSTRLRPDELSEERVVALEPGLEREALDGSRSRGDGIRLALGAGREPPRRPAPPAREAHLARSRRDAARRCPRRRRRAPEHRRYADTRREALTPSPRARRSGTGHSPSCAAGRAPDGRAPEHRAASSGRPRGRALRGPARCTSGSTGIASRPVTRSCASGSSSRSTASVRRASSRR